jgi:hypothetical protein
MVTRRTFLASLLVSVGAVRPIAALRQSQGLPVIPPKAAVAIPPVSYSCPMHAEVVDDKAGKCPICGMTMIPVRLAFVWTCRNHTDITSLTAGKCKRDGTDMIRVTKAVTFTCPVHAKVDELNPGKCPTCKRTLVPRYSVRPHGDHNPKHGGYFFMASNNWHIEVTHPSAGLFRLYVYNEYSKPFIPEGLTARVIEQTDKNGQKKPLDVGFVEARNKQWLDAKVPELAVPATMAIKVRFEPNDKEYRFDFFFTEYSKDPSAPARSGR